MKFSVIVISYLRYRDKKMVGARGFFGDPNGILINDPGLIKQMFVKDFDHFTGKKAIDFRNKYLNSALFVLEGDRWRRARHASTPVFTSGKLRQMSRGAIQ